MKAMLLSTMALPAAPKDRPAKDLHPAALLTCLTLGHKVRIPYEYQSFVHLCTKPSLFDARESSNQFLSRSLPEIGFIHSGNIPHSPPLLGSFFVTAYRRTR